MDFLHIHGGCITDESGHPVRLRGTCVGGWMNMEDFINGYPGTESGIRAALAHVMGEDMSAYFFDCMADNFFTEEDVRLISATGANCVRLALSYRHFEEDRAPLQYLERGFARLDAALEWCERHGVYVILDMHCVAGWQNSHWHCDNNRGASVFWRHPHFQERLSALWQEFARRYSKRAVVAAYGLMNEPSCGNPDGEHGFDFYRNYRSDWPLFNRVCHYLVSAIRQVDPDHIIMLEGDMYSRRFSGLDPDYGNHILLSNHHYIAPGFGPGEYPGYYSAGDTKVYWDRQYICKNLMEQEGWVFAQENGLPLLVSEFGAQYHGPQNETGHRLQTMADQTDVYNQYGLHWTSWTYKDAGIMGWVTLNPQGEYSRRIAPVQKMKRVLGCENFVALYEQSPGREKSRELADMILDVSGLTGIDPAENGFTFNYAALTGYAASTLQRAYAQVFSDMTRADIRHMMEDFSLGKCVRNERFLQILRERLKQLP